MSDNRFDNKVRVYIGDIGRLSSRPDLYEELYKNLSEFRKSKVDRLRPLADKCRAVGAGAILSLALSNYGLSEKNAVYGFGDNGKPFIEGYPEICFNISHSKDRVMCVTAGFPVGCDVEAVRMRTKTNSGVVRRFFSESEKKLLENASLNGEKEFNDLFYKIWTLKESYIKYTGMGLKCPMDSFSVTEDRNGETELRTLDIEDEEYKYAVCFASSFSDVGMFTEKIVL